MLLLAWSGKVLRCQCTIDLWPLSETCLQLPLILCYNLKGITQTRLRQPCLKPRARNAATVQSAGQSEGQVLLRSAVAWPPSCVPATQEFSTVVSPVGNIQKISAGETLTLSKLKPFQLHFFFPCTRWKIIKQNVKNIKQRKGTFKDTELIKMLKMREFDVRWEFIFVMHVC